MRLHASCLALFVLLAAAATAAAAQDPPPVPAAASAAFEVVTVAEGVHAVLRKEPPGLMADANVVFLVNQEDVIVVDTNIGGASAKESIAVLRRLTTKPVRYVVNTGWQIDHVLGNQAYREAFPNVEIIAQTLENHDTVLPALTQRAEAHYEVPKLIASMESRMAEGKNLAGGPLTEEEQASYESDIRLAERFLVEKKPSSLVHWPTMAVEERVAFRRGLRTIEVRHLGRGNTAADLVVHLPEEDILIAGDLVTWPVPRLDSASSPAALLETLQSLVALRPRVIIPGHGPVMRDLNYVRLVIRLLTSLKRQVWAAVERGETLEQVRKSLDLEPFRELFAGGSPVRGAIFEAFVAGSGVAAAYREATEER